MGRSRLILKCYEETIAFGQRMAAVLPKTSVLALTGDLGAGKTTFVQGLALGLGITDKVQSPTFVLLNLYEGLAHFDLYRLKTSEDFLALGFDEYLQKGHLCAIEWPDRIANLLPANTVHLHFSYEGDHRVVEQS
jgi:tRNA threonylcarbamoyladenosine biosynthesis protein TsaE